MPVERMDCKTCRRFLRNYLTEGEIGNNEDSHSGRLYS